MANHQSKLSPDQWADVMTAYVRGDGVRELAEQYGISAAAITQHASRHGYVRKRIRREYVAKPAPKARRVAPPPAAPIAIFYTQTASEVVRLHQAGRTRAEIAALLRMPYRDIEAALALRV